MCGLSLKVQMKLNQGIMTESFIMMTDIEKKLPEKEWDGQNQLAQIVEVCVCPWFCLLGS